MSAKVLRWLLLVVLAAGIAVALLNQDRLDAAALEVWVRATGAAAPLLLIALYDCAMRAVVAMPDGPIGQFRFTSENKAIGVTTSG